MVIKVVGEDDEGFDSVSLVARLSPCAIDATATWIVPYMRERVMCGKPEVLRVKLAKCYRRNGSKLHMAFIESVDSIADRDLVHGEASTSRADLCRSLAVQDLKGEWFSKAECYTGVKALGTHVQWNGVTDAIGALEGSREGGVVAWLA